MIDCQNLVKHYGPLLAVDGLSFQVQAGEVLGFLGPNGAGKSTTMRVIAGFLPASSGRVTVCGHDIATEATAAKACIGYLPEGAPSYPEMTPRAFLDFVADIRGMQGESRRSRLNEIYGLLHLEPVLEQSIDTLSKGYKRRVGLAQALLHDPKVLILDEPTDGLDPNQKHEVRQLINAMATDKIIIISTHLLEEVDALCNRAIIIARGRILADDTPANLEARSKFHNAVSLRLADDTALEQVRKEIDALGDVERTEVDANASKLTAFPAPGRMPLTAISELGAARGWEFAELHLESGRLDEVFRTITGGAAA
jgi:ABC-2 type transport system ATP-binding protein